MAVATAAVTMARRNMISDPFVPRSLDGIVDRMVAEAAYNARHTITGGGCYDQRRAHDNRGNRILSRDDARRHRRSLRPAPGSVRGPRRGCARGGLRGRGDDRESGDGRA